MIRGLLRLLSMVALSVAVIMAVLDATRSIATEALVLTPLVDSWASVSPATLEGFDAFVMASLPAIVHEFVLMPVLEFPGFAVFVAIALLLYVAGRKPERRGRLVLEN